MQFFRIFSYEKYRGTKGYLNTQRTYEVLRTALYFGISLSLFAAGWIATGSRLNLLTVVAVLGCLPACKSLVGAVMFFRFRSCPPHSAEEIDAHVGDLLGLYDLVFTSYEKNYPVDHLAVRGNTVCGFSSAEHFDEQGFYRHMTSILKADGHGDVSLKIFRDLGKYTERLEQMKGLEEDRAHTERIAETFRSVAL